MFLFLNVDNCADQFETWVDNNGIHVLLVFIVIVRLLLKPVFFRGGGGCPKSDCVLGRFF